jgi:hypothetical protein
MYEIHGEQGGRLIVVRCIGFWNDAELNAYCAAFVRQGRAARGTFDAIVDMLQFPPQKAGGGPEIQAMVGELVRLGLRHVAILTPSAIHRMQANRIGGGRQLFFEDEASARAWLMQARLAS